MDLNYTNETTSSLKYACSQMYLISIDRYIDDTNQQLFSSLMKRCYVLTHDFELQNIRLRISLDVWRDARVNSGLLSRHTLQHQTRSAHDDSRSFFLLNHHILKYSRNFFFSFSFYQSSIIFCEYSAFLPLCFFVSCWIINRFTYTNLEVWSWKFQKMYFVYFNYIIA